MRETYRRNKSSFYTVILNSGEQYALAIVYTGKTIIELKALEPKIQLALNTLADHIHDNLLPGGTQEA